MLKLTHVGSTVNVDIFVEQSWSTWHNLTNVHGDQVTPNLAFVMIEIDRDKTSFDLKCRGVNP